MFTQNSVQRHRIDAYLDKSTPNRTSKFRNCLVHLPNAGLLSQVAHIFLGSANGSNTKAPSFMNIACAKNKPKNVTVTESQCTQYLDVVDATVINVKKISSRPM